MAARLACAMKVCSKRPSNRPQTGYYQDVIEEAAALWESLSQNHPFIDGNKRVAVSAAIVFLGINGLRISPMPTRVHIPDRAL